MNFKFLKEERIKRNYEISSLFKTGSKVVLKNFIFFLIKLIR